MAIKIAGFSDEITPDFSAQLDALKDLSIDYMEIRSVNGRNISTFAPEEAAELKKQLDKKGIKISSIGSPAGKVSIEEDFDTIFEEFKNLVLVAGALGTQYIRVFSFYIPEKNYGAYRDEVLARLEPMIAFAREHDIILLHENESKIYGEMADRCYDLLSHFDSPNFRAVFDFANFVQSGEDTLTAFELLSPYTEYIHLKDASAKTGQNLPAGMGDGNIPAIFAKLKEQNYSGFVSLEPHLKKFGGEVVVEKATSFEQEKIPFTLALHALKAILWDLNWR